MSKKQFNEMMMEVGILETLDHPNIVKYIETYCDSQYLYLVMESCSGGELLDHNKKTKNEKKFTEHDVAHIMESCLSAINHAHALKIAHRDIKPENIMWGEDGTVRLVDFGLSV